MKAEQGADRGTIPTYSPPMRSITIISYTILISIVLIYTFFRSQVFIFGPVLEVQFPEPHQKVSSVFTIKGTAHNVTFLSVNDQRVYPEKNGSFEKDLALPTGYTIVKLYAHDRQKRERVIHFPLYIQPYDAK